jgi:hypothetical protein
MLPVPLEKTAVRLTLAPKSGLVVLGDTLVATGNATTVMLEVVDTEELASLLAVSVHNPVDPGAVQVVFAPLAVVVGLKEPPQLSVQSTEVSKALDTVAFAVAEYPGLTLIALVVTPTVTVLGITVTELSRLLPAALVARNQ